MSVTEFGTSNPDLPVEQVKQVKKKRTWRLFRSPSARRLEPRLPIIKTELESLQASPEKTWFTYARQLYDMALEASGQDDYEKGWQCLKAADRFMYHGLNNEQLNNRACAIYHEAQDESKGLSKWRQKSILDLLKGVNLDPAVGNSKPLEVDRVIEAKRLLDDHQDNVYFKLKIVNARLMILSWIGLGWIAAWLTVNLFIPLDGLVVDNTLPSPYASLGSTPLLFWCVIILAGILGSLISSFTSIISTDPTKKRIPEELSAGTVTFARLMVSALSAIAVTLLIVSGLLSLGVTSFPLIIAAAFVSGFSDRILMSTIGKLS